MSSQLLLKGIFKNGKVRNIGSYISTNGLNNSKLLFDKEDLQFISRMLESGKSNFNYCIENNKFSKIQVLLYIDGKEYIINDNLKVKNRIDKKTILKYIFKANTMIKLFMIEKGYKYKFNSLTEEEKEKVFFYNVNKVNTDRDKEKINFYNKMNNDNILINIDNKEYINIICPFK